MTSRRLTFALWLLGSATLLASVAWWWLVYRQVVNSALLSMPRAVPCLVGSSDLCVLAQALCTSSEHVLGIRHYQTYLFWTGACVVAAAALPPLARRYAASARAS